MPARIAPLPFRRALRRASADAERALWSALRSRRLAGVKFRRQCAVGPYVLDFYCPGAALGVEADGGQHFTDEGRARDAVRGDHLAREGIRVIRFTDREVLAERERVIEAIWREVTRRR